MKRARNANRRRPPMLHAAVMRRLLAQAKLIIANSTAADAVGLDADAWLKKWVCVAHPALGWRAPRAMFGSEAGEAAVERALGAIASGTYQ